MKKTITVTLLLLSAVAFGQPPQHQTWTSSGTEFFSPLYSIKPNTTNGTYFNTWTTSNNGTQLDTSCAACRQSPVKLATATIKKLGNKAGTLDTISPSALLGRGKITVSLEAYHASTTSTTNPTCVATLYQSDDFYSWVPVSGAAVSTLTPSSVYSSTLTAVPSSGIATWSFFDKGSQYYMVGVSVTGDTASFRSTIHYMKDATIQLGVK